MKHIPDGAQGHLPIAEILWEGPPAKPGDCLSCHIRTAFNHLGSVMELLLPRALRKRRRCQTAGRCQDTGQKAGRDEPPHIGDRECRLIHDLADAMFDVRSQLEQTLGDADQMSRILERSETRKGVVREIAPSASPAGEV